MTDLELIRDLRDCVDNCGCICTDPPGDRGEDTTDWEAHSQYCWEYLAGLIDAHLAAAEIAEGRTG